MRRRHLAAQILFVLMPRLAAFRLPTAAVVRRRHCWATRCSSSSSSSSASQPLELSFYDAAAEVRQASLDDSDKGQSGTPIAVEAWVARRRPISNGLAFLDLACEDPDAPPLQALLKLQPFRHAGFRRR